MTGQKKVTATSDRDEVSVFHYFMIVEGSDHSTGATSQSELKQMRGLTLNLPQFVLHSSFQVLGFCYDVLQLIGSSALKLLILLFVL